MPVTDSGVRRIVREALQGPAQRSLQACPSCQKPLMGIAALADRSRSLARAGELASPETQVHALRAAVELLASGLQCHLGLCLAGDRTSGRRVLVEGVCPTCRKPLPSLQKLERQLTRLIKRLDLEFGAGDGRALIDLDLGLTRALETLDCRLGRCG